MRHPFAPWRFVLAVSLLITAIPLGVAASMPGINTADLLATAWPFVFVATVRPLIPTKEKN